MSVLNYTQKFQLGNGKFVYVQEGKCRDNGQKLIQWCLRRWKPPGHYFHYQDGGHVAAIKIHLKSQYFARADLERFFWHVTRNKVVRALKRIGVRYSDAYEYAVNATVADKGRYFLPFGFVESPYLATICLDKSKLGLAFRELMGKGIKLSVYVDDVILSGDDRAELEEALELIGRVGSEVGFPLNATKVQRAGPEVSAFNIEAGTGRMAVTDHRMREFEAAVLEAGDGPRSRAIIAYVSTVNRDQSEALAELIGV
ncbi:reverse transcriptase domain-containing protein [Phaeospirillum tilakii]|uniref:Reverse transcriptase domain-containing protein n=1 Tax=Phaeospirillum tilakii TaxID=741673 RepID=A0ABW5CAB3_9PROT